MVDRKSGQKSSVRIIGGSWRGRKLQFHASEGLRPSADRVRETLFNWLAEEVPGAHCLDLFSGSGVLGMEALSRGAADCLMLDNSRQSCADINSHLLSLGGDNGHCLQAEAIAFLERGPAGRTPMNIVFLDPPFGKGLVQTASTALELHAWLATDAWIYVETSRREPTPELPANWRLHRDKNAGEVRFQLFVRSA